MDEGFDKENNNREDKHQLYKHKSRVCQKSYHTKYMNGHKRDQNDDEMEPGECKYCFARKTVNKNSFFLGSTESLREKAKQLEDRGSHSVETEHQNECVCHETNREEDKGDGK